MANRVNFWVGDRELALRTTPMSVFDYYFLKNVDFDYINIPRTH